MHGAAGGVGTATLQVASGMGARTIAVVSTEEKAEVARAAGADEVVLVDGFKDAVKELTGGNGVDVVLDVVGGDAFTDSLRSLATQGRLLVVGFASGQGIPEVKVNRLLLNNVDVRGVGWGAFAMMRPGYMQEQWQALVPMMESGVVKPPIGAASTTSRSSARRWSRWTSAAPWASPWSGSVTDPKTLAARPGGVRRPLRLGTDRRRRDRRGRGPRGGGRRAVVHDDPVRGRRARASPSSLIAGATPPPSSTPPIAAPRSPAAAPRASGVTLSPASVLAAPELERLVLPSPNGSSISFGLAGSGVTVVGAVPAQRAAVARWLAPRLGPDRGWPWSPPVSAGPTVRCALRSRTCGARGRCWQRWATSARPVSARRRSRPLSRSPPPSPLSATMLRASASGRELDAIGFGDDVRVAGELDVSDVVPVLEGDAFTASGP